MLQLPCERHAAHKAHQQRGISDGRQAAADIGHQEYEKHHCLHTLAAPAVGPQNGADHHHGRPGSTDPGGQSRTNQQQQHIGLGRAGQIAFQADIARHTKQAEQQHDKCQVIAHQRFQQLIHHGRHIICKRKRNQEQQRPEQNKQPAPFFPLLRDHQRAYGNTQQHAHKRYGKYQRNPRAEFGAVHNFSGKNTRAAQRRCSSGQGQNR